jgi:hypothetical protein
VVDGASQVRLADDVRHVERGEPCAVLLGAVDLGPLELACGVDRNDLFVVAILEEEQDGTEAARDGGFSFPAGAEVLEVELQLQLVGVQRHHVVTCAPFPERFEVELVRLERLGCAVGEEPEERLLFGCHVRDTRDGSGAEDAMFDSVRRHVVPPA